MQWTETRKYTVLKGLIKESFEIIYCLSSYAAVTLFTSWVLMGTSSISTQCAVHLDWG